MESKGNDVFLRGNTTAARPIQHPQMFLAIKVESYSGGTSLVTSLVLAIFGRRQSSGQDDQLIEVEADVECFIVSGK